MNMKRWLTILFIGTTLHGCQKDFIEEYPENSSATRTIMSTSEYYYWCDGVKIPLTINENKLFVQSETTNYQNARKSVGGIIENVRTTSDYASLGIESMSKSTKMRGSFTSYTLDDPDSKPLNTDDLIYVAPYYKTSDGADIGITNVFEVGLKGEHDIAKLQKVAEEYKLEMLECDFRSERHGEIRREPHFASTKHNHRTAIYRRGRRDVLYGRMIF